jgi:hypothetical protein
MKLRRRIAFPKAQTVRLAYQWLLLQQGFAARGMGFKMDCGAKISKAGCR